MHGKGCELTVAKRQTVRAMCLSVREAVVPWEVLINWILPPAPGAAWMAAAHHPPGDTAANPAAAAVAFAPRPGHGRCPDRGAHRCSRWWPCVGHRSHPDEATILTSRPRLEMHRLGQQILEPVDAQLSAKGMTKRQSTIVDATSIATPGSTRTTEEKCDPDLHHTNKRNPRSHHCLDGQACGISTHAGLNRDSGRVPEGGRDRHRPRPPPRRCAVAG